MSSCMSVHTGAQNGSGAGTGYARLRYGKKSGLTSVKGESIFDNGISLNRINSNINTVGKQSIKSSNTVQSLPPELPDLKNNLVLNYINTACSSLISQIATVQNNPGNKGKGSGRQNEHNSNEDFNDESRGESGDIQDELDINEFAALVKKFESSDFDNICFV